MDPLGTNSSSMYDLLLRDRAASFIAHRALANPFSILQEWLIAFNCIKSKIIKTCLRYLVNVSSTLIVLLVQLEDKSKVAKVRMPQNNGINQYFHSKTNKI